MAAPHLTWPKPLVPGTLIHRYKRFLADVRLDHGGTITVHVPNSGAMTGCNRPGSRVRLSHSPNPKRKYAHTLEMVRAGRFWVGVNTHAANRLVGVALERGGIPELQGYSDQVAEVMVGKHTRLDWRLSGPQEVCMVEVKNVSLVESETAMFPDAVTLRGLKHLKELEGLVRQGTRAVALFVVQRRDAVRFRPAWQIDPEFSHGLVRAAECGVEVLAYGASVSPRGIRLIDRLPVELSD